MMQLTWYCIRTSRSRSRRELVIHLMHIGNTHAVADAKARAQHGQVVHTRQATTSLNCLYWRLSCGFDLRSCIQPLNSVMLHGPCVTPCTSKHRILRTRPLSHQQGGWVKSGRRQATLATVSAVRSDLLPSSFHEWLQNQSEHLFCSPVGQHNTNSSHCSPSP